MIFDEKEKLEEYELHKGGTISYYPNFLSKRDQKHLLDELIEGKMWKKKKNNRLTKDVMFSNTEFMLYVKDRIENRINQFSIEKRIDTYIAHYYRNGSDYACYKYDRGVSAIVSLGVRRRFVLREKYDDMNRYIRSGLPQYEIYLKSGSLLIMNDVAYKYSLPKVRKKDECDGKYGYVQLCLSVKE